MRTRPGGEWNSKVALVPSTWTPLSSAVVGADAERGPPQPATSGRDGAQGDEVPHLDRLAYMADVERPATLGPKVPFPPMEAELVAELPEQAGAWRYEPKWDGFRGLLERNGDEVALWSRNGRPLLRYFPELRAIGELLPPDSALDGEIVISREGKLDFDAMQMRLHPAESRVRKLSAEIPAMFVAFDLLLWDGAPVHERPIEDRRAELERLATGVPLSPVLRRRRAGPRVAADAAGGRLRRRDREEARAPVSPGLARRRRQGEAAQDRGLRRRRRALEEGRPLDDRDAAARPVCATTATSTTSARVRSARRRRPRSRRRCCRSSTRATTASFSEPNRWGTGDLEQTALLPELVVEVRFDKLEKRRFRHGTKLVRFRDDKDPAQCTWQEVRPPRRPDDLSVEDLTT